MYGGLMVILDNMISTDNNRSIQIGKYIGVHLISIEDFIPISSSNIDIVGGIGGEIILLFILNITLLKNS